MNTLKELVGNRKTLSKKSKAKRNEVLSSRKKAAKDFYISMLRYSPVFDKRVQEFNKYVEDARCPERKKAHADMCKLNTNGLWDTSWWWRAPFFDLCWSGFDSGCSGETKQPETDELFWNDVARRAFQKFLKFVATLSLETSISTLIRFDAITIDAIDTLTKILTQCKLFKLVAQARIELHQMSQKNCPKIPSLGETVPMKVQKSWNVYFFLPLETFCAFAIKYSESAVLNVRRLKALKQVLLRKERLKEDSTTKAGCTLFVLSCLLAANTMLLGLCEPSKKFYGNGWQMAMIAKFYTQVLQSVCSISIEKSQRNYIQKCWGAWTTQTYANNRCFCIH